VLRSFIWLKLFAFFVRRHPGRPGALQSLGRHHPLFFRLPCRNAPLAGGFLLKKFKIFLSLIQLSLERL
jgi:hypothetical protein